MNHRHFLTLAPLTLALALALAGCGRSSSGSATPAPPTPKSYSVGGTVTGLSLGKSVTLQDNGGDDLTLSGTGSDQNFSFTTGLASRGNYAVTVSAQPTGMKCSVTNGSGTMGGSAVSTVAVNCLNLGETVLYSFGAKPDGQIPDAGLVLDANGNMYGTTFYGGSTDTGTVFKITPAGNETLLHSFGTGTDGQLPQAGLIQDASGTLYGTTINGGANNTGTVFKIPPSGTQPLLYSFGPTTSTDGQNPYANLMMDASGTLYGTTYYGGTNNAGTVFKISPSGTESVLYSFGTGTDGQNPYAGLVLDASGNLCGTTLYGGTNNTGTVFKITPAGAESMLYSFGPTTGTNGRNPATGLVMDASGTLYGTTAGGGANGFGTVFQITPSGTEAVLHSFGAGSDGQNPRGNLILDAGGNLYGTTADGGTTGNGTVFKIDSAGTESVLYSFFGGGTDGQSPSAGLVMDASGNLYGTTQYGGPNNRGTVFVFVP